VTPDARSGANPDTRRGLLRRIRAAAFLVALLGICVGVCVGTFAFVQSAQRSGTALWLASGVLAICLLLVAASVMQRSRGDRRGRRHAAGVKLARHDVRTSLALTVPDWEQLLPRLDLVREASAALPIAERERLMDGLREAGAVGTLEQRLAHTRSKWARAEQLDLLGWLDTEEAIPTLRHVASDSDPELAEIATQALAFHHTRPAYETLLDALREEWLPRSRVAALLEGAQYPSPVAALALRASDPDPQMRFWVAYLLGRSGAADALSALEQLAADEDSDVRANAAEALGAIPGLTPLAALLEDPSWVVRAHAAKAAGNAGRLDLTPQLVALLPDPAWWVRQDAALALKQLGAGTVEEVREALRSDDRFAREKAAEVLDQLGYRAEEPPFRADDAEAPQIVLT
jgi:HEAT repeat protein